MNTLIDLIPHSPTFAIWAMLIACLLPFVFTWIAKMAGKFTAEDNANPREALDKLTGLPARANAVQQNSFETLPMFLVAVVLAMYFFVPQVVVNTLAGLYVVVRIIYGIAYLLNLPFFRSVIWTLSMVCIFMLFWLTIKFS